MTTKMIHKFEEAGLGLAPFIFIGTETAGDRAAEQRHREANGLTFTTNYCTSCDYCSTAIQNAFFVRSADGKTFKVGCECIKKTGDAGLIRHVEREEKAKAAAKRREARNTKWQRQAMLDDWFKSGKYNAVANLADHPLRPGTADTLLDYLNWFQQNPIYKGAKYYAWLEELDAMVR